MEVEISNLEKLDLKQLRQLVALKENSKQLTRLETRRQRLKKELDEIEADEVGVVDAEGEGDAVLVRVGMRIGLGRAASGERDGRAVDAREFQASDLLVVATTEEGGVHDDARGSCAAERRRGDVAWECSRCPRF